MKLCLSALHVLLLQPVVGDGARTTLFKACISPRDPLGLDRVACHFSYGSLAGLVSGVGSGGFIRQVQQEAVKEFIHQSRVTTDALRRDLAASVRMLLSLQKERDAAAEKAGEWEGLCKQLDETKKQRVLEVEHEL
jgi:hypothetical protein